MQAWLGEGSSPRNLGVRRSVYQLCGTQDLPFSAFQTITAWSTERKPSGTLYTSCKSMTSLWRALKVLTGDVSHIGRLNRGWTSCCSRTLCAVKITIKELLSL